jgi:hypothetical protein
VTKAEVYGACTIKRDRRTRDRVAQLDRQIADVFIIDHSQSVPHIFYRMTNPRLIEPVEKSESGYRHTQYRSVALRRACVISYGWITDASRRGYFINTFADRFNFVRQISGLYRSDLWSHNDCYCEVWTAARSIASVIDDDCREFAVPLFPAARFSSITLAYQAAEQINAEHNGRHLIIFYIGDYDPAGVLIDVALKSELRRHLDPHVSMEFVRLGITPEQIVQYNLPTKQRKKTDRRSPHVAETVEAEAMPAGILRGLLRNFIEALLPTGAPAAARAAEESERNLLRSWANGGRAP